MKHWWKIAFLLSIFWGLAACDAPEVEVTAVPPTRTVAPMETMTGTAVSPSPTPAPTQTMTGTAVSPTQTATPTPTLPPTETATKTATPTTTPTPVLTFVDGLCGLCQPTTLAELAEMTISSVGGVKKAPFVYVPQEDQHSYAVWVTYTGQYREIDPTRKLVVEAIAHRWGPDTQNFIEDFQHEVLVMEDGVEQWLVLQESLFWDFEELEAGSEMALNIDFEGAIVPANQEIDPVFLIWGQPVLENPSVPIWPTVQTVETGTRLEMVNQMGGSLTAVAVQNNLAYLGIGPRLAVSDLSDLAQPQVVSWSHVLPGIAHQIILRDNLAYVALGEAGLWIIDVADPMTFYPVGHVQTTNPARHFLLQGNLAYVVNQSQDPLSDQVLSVVDLTDPYQPVEISTLPLPVQPDNLFMVNGYLYISFYPHHADFENTLWVVDVSDPYHPEVVMDAPELAGRAFAVKENHLFTGVDGGLIIKDVSDPANPVEIARYSKDEPNYFESHITVVHAYQDTVWVVGWIGFDGGCDTTLYTVDISDLSNIQQFSPPLSIDCGYDEIVYLNDRPYLTNGYRMMDLTDTAHPTYTLFSGSSMLPSMSDLEIGDDLYGRRGSDIYTFDLTNPAQPQWVGTDEFEDEVNDFVAAGSHLFMGTYWGGIVKIDITDPTQLQPVAASSEEYLTENSSNLVLADERLYALLSGNLGIFDPATLEWLGGDELVELWNGREVPKHGTYTSIAADNSIVWVWENGSASERAGLLAFDATNPAQLTEIGFLQAERDDSYNTVFVNQGYGYILSNCGGRSETVCQGTTLSIVDVTDPTAMKFVTTVTIPDSVSRLAIYDDRLLLIGGDLWLMDVSDPAQPLIVSSIQTPGYAQDAVVRDGLIYVADGAGGLLVLRPLE